MFLNNAHHCNFTEVNGGTVNILVICVNLYENLLEKSYQTINVNKIIQLMGTNVDIRGSVYYPYLIGRKGDTRRRLEMETGSSINIPPRGAGVTEEIGEISYQ